MNTKVRAKALICEDDMIGRRVVELFVSPYADCSPCESGLEAVRLFEEALAAGEPYTLALLDANVPELPGLEVLKRIREAEKTHGVTEPCTIVMITGRQEPEFMAQVEAFGVDRYLLKPIAETALIKELSELGIITPEED